MASPLLRWLLIGAAIAVLVAASLIGALKFFGPRPLRTEATAPQVQTPTEPAVKQTTPPKTQTNTKPKTSVPAVPEAQPSTEESITSKTVAEAVPPARNTGNAPGRDYVILQIGDSHTAADLFTGEVRDRLQEKFGAGGLFLPPGEPKAGVQSAEFSIKTDSAWQYEAMASTDEPNHFWLSGYTAKARQAGARITFTARGKQAFDAIDVSFLRSAGGGQADVILDGVTVDHVTLDGPPGDPLIRRLMPSNSVATFKTLEIVTTSGGQVEFNGVFVDQRQSGVSYLSVGFPGARVTVLKRMSPANFADDMARLNPDMVVLAFGTNEGFDDNLDVAEYKRTLGGIVTLMQMGNPNLKVVIVGPPPGARQEKSCTEVRTACGTPTTGSACWAQPPKLEGVRQAEREIAKEMGATFWDWSSVLPSACALEQGHLGDPAIFGPDRVHMTARGYRDSADAFAQVLIPLIGKAMGG